jgi:CheY-like chemotaxis protein
VVVLDRDLADEHGNTLSGMITDDEPAMIPMLTAANAPTESVAGLALGADDYLSKPFHSPSSSSVSARSPAVSPLPSVAPCARRKSSLTKSRTASRDGRQLDLLTKEFGVLEALRKASPIRGTQKSQESGEDASPTRARG